MPSYIRLLTEQPAHIGTPPTGHTALYASSGTGTESKYELYIKNPEGFSHPVGMFASGGTVSGHAVFNSGVTSYSGGYTTSGSPFVALAINGTLSGVTNIGGNAWNGGILIQRNLTVSGGSDGVGGAISGVTTIAIGSGHTMDGRSIGTFASVFGKGHTASGLVSGAFGSGNTASEEASFALGRVTTASGKYSFAGGSASTASAEASFAFGGGNNATAHMATAFGTGNTASAAASFAIGTGTTASGLGTFAAGSATTASGTSHFVVGRGNITSDLFTVGNGSGTTAALQGNAFSVGSSGVTILNSGKTGNDYVSPLVAALTVYSGAGHNSLGVMLPWIEDHDANKFNFDPTLSATTQHNGLMFWDGTAIRVYTGGTTAGAQWAKVGLVDNSVDMTGANNADST